MKDIACAGIALPWIVYVFFTGLFSGKNNRDSGTQHHVSRVGEALGVFKLIRLRTNKV